MKKILIAIFALVSTITSAQTEYTMDFTDLSQYFFYGRFTSVFEVVEDSLLVESGKIEKDKRTVYFSRVPKPVVIREVYRDMWFRYYYDKDLDGLPDILEIYKRTKNLVKFKDNPKESGEKPVESYEIYLAGDIHEKIMIRQDSVIYKFKK